MPNTQPETSSTNNQNKEPPFDPTFTSFAEKICDLDKNQLILELTKRGLLIIGDIPELKTRLLHYLNGESLPSDFTTFEERNFSPIINHTQKKNMENKKPYFKPGTFSGQISDNISSFLKKYQRAATINGWSDEDKAQFLVAFLEGPAITFYENLESNHHGIPSWNILEKLFRAEYESITQIDLLRSVLQKRKQLDDELTVTYINDAESLCRRIDPLMSQEEIVRNIRKGLKPSIARYIGVLENNTISELKENIRKYETVEFMITGETIQSPSEINTNIIKQQINAITNEHVEQINKLTELNNKMKKQIEENYESQKNKNHTHNYTPQEQYYKSQQLNIQKPTFPQNQYPTSQYRYNTPQNQYNNSQTQHPYSQYRYNHPQNQHTPPQHKYYQTQQQQTYQKNYKNPYQNQNHAQTNPFNIHTNAQNNTQQYYNNKIKCEICSKTNHIKENCYYKNNQLICQICNKIGHVAANCFKNTQYSKN